jgi:hypothetical protein
MDKLNASVLEVADLIKYQHLKIKILRAKISKMYTLPQVTKIYETTKYSGKHSNMNNQLVKPINAVYHQLFSEILKNEL